MIDYYLQAADEAAMGLALAPYIEAEGVAIDIIGTWYDPPIDEESPPIARAGYYANVRSRAPIAWPEGIVQQSPDTPWRVWA